MWRRKRMLPMGVTRFMASMLDNVRPDDPATMAGAGSAYRLLRSRSEG